MMPNPQVSVVMSVYNGADCMRESIESVLSQEGVRFEFIVVNDGSTDRSGALLDEIAAAEPRIRIIHQANQGLTGALIRGCSEVRGTYIARQDAGDLFLPGKLKRQVEVLESHPEAAFVSCGTRVVGPGEEHLHDLLSDEWDSTRHLLTLDLDKLKGPFGHGSVLFRRDLYERVGGYRKEFYFGQDVDLWIRLAEVGPLLMLPEILFQVAFTPNSISGRHRSVQISLAKQILECARLRRAGISEAEPLARASEIRTSSGRSSGSDLAAGLYFIGTCLTKRRDPRARRYYRDALHANPLHFRSAIRLLLG